MCTIYHVLWRQQRAARSNPSLLPASVTAARPSNKSFQGGRRLFTRYDTYRTRKPNVSNPTVPHLERIGVDSEELVEVVAAGTGGSREVLQPFQLVGQSHAKLYKTKPET